MKDLSEFYEFGLEPNLLCTSDAASGRLECGFQKIKDMGKT